MWEVPVHRISKHILEEDMVAPQMQKRTLRPLTAHLARGAPLSCQLRGNSVLTLRPDHSSVIMWLRVVFSSEAAMCVSILRHPLLPFVLEPLVPS